MGKFDHFIQDRFLRFIRLKTILKIINKLPSGTILDIGCMDDYLLKKVPKRFEYLGYDENPLSKNNRIIKDKVENISKDKNFDIVLCTEVLEHLDNPVDMINKIKKISKRFVLISVPNEPFFSMARLFFPAKEHLWTIYPWALEKHLGKPIFKTLTCFRRTYVALWDLNKSS
jgi:SAM-dependent methyltransferase